MNVPLCIAGEMPASPGQIRFLNVPLCIAGETPASPGLIRNIQPFIKVSGVHVGDAVLGDHASNVLLNLWI